MKTPDTFYCLLLVYLFCLSGRAFSQQNELNDDLNIQLQIENNTELVNQENSSDNETDYSSVLEDLIQYRTHPLNLNTASKAELQHILLLNDLQVEALLNHINRYGKLISLEELQSIDGFDLSTIYALLPYVKISPLEKNLNFSFHDLIHAGRTIFLIRYQQILQQQNGFLTGRDSNTYEKRYTGSAGKLFARYRYSSGNALRLGITGEKDAGEEFFRGSQKQGFDFYSAHLFYSGSGWLKTLVLGDFQVQYGQGLTMWSGPAFGKSGDAINIKKNARGLMPYTSVDENHFMRGTGIAIGYQFCQLDFFFSNHPIDGNIRVTDSLSQAEIVSSFVEGGYHRDSAELKTKHTTWKKISGMHAQLKSRSFTLGFTGYAVQFNRAILKTPHPYNRFDFSGQRSSTIGIDYSYLFHNFHFFGEVAKSNTGAISALTGLLASLDRFVAVSVLYRRYDKKYAALEANPFSENSTGSNEEGLYFGIQLNFAKHFSCNAYFDQFAFPWLRFSSDAPTAGMGNLLQVNYKPSKTFEAYFKIKHQNKPVNISADLHPISHQHEVDQINYRFHLSYSLSSTLTLANRLEFITCEKEANTREKGFILYQDIQYQTPEKKYSVSIRYMLFDTDSYDTRIYAYENDVLYAYSIPSYYYRGNRFYLTAHDKIAKGVDLWLRYSTTIYDNQKTIGNGPDEINGNQKSELKAQVRFEF